MAIEIPNVKALVQLVVMGLLFSTVPPAIGQQEGKGDGRRIKDALDLCSRIAEIKQIPIKAGEGRGGDFRNIDPVYDRFRVLGEAAVPCLIDELTNQTTMVDPLGSPHFGGVVTRAGDTALWVIADITGLDPTSMVPASVRKDWNGDRGVRAYFAWIKIPANRLLLRTNVKAWWNSRQASTKQTLTK